jgi:hypothetical protein
MASENDYTPLINGEGIVYPLGYEYNDTLQPATGSMAGSTPEDSTEQRAGASLFGDDSVDVDVSPLDINGTDNYDNNSGSSASSLAEQTQSAETGYHEAVNEENNAENLGVSQEEYTAAKDFDAEHPGETQNEPTPGVPVDRGDNGDPIQPSQGPTATVSFNFAPLTSCCLLR